MSELLALGAALGFASGSVSMKFATGHGSMRAGHLMSLAAGVLVVGGACLVMVDSWRVPVLAVVFFGCAGLVGPGVGRFMSMRGVHEAGASVAIPIQSSTNPLVATMAGLAVFGEEADPLRLAALGIILSGLWICARGGSANLLGSSPARFGGRYGVSVWPLFAGVAYAVSDVGKKFGLSGHDDPLLGSFIGLSVALACWLVVYGVRIPLRRLREGVPPGLGWYALSGVLQGLAATSLMFALRDGDLSVVSPIVASQPVIIVVLGAVLLRDVERLRAGTVAGAVAVFLGLTTLAWSSG